MRALLLQGPVGPFFSTLQSQMADAGWDTLRVLLDGGDLWFAGKGPSVTWTGRTAFEPWLETLLTSYRPTHILLFGADRPAHIIARRLAATRNIPVLCMEEGYLRPGFMTAEWGGNNHASPLHTQPLTSGPAPIPARITPGMLPLVLWSAIYYTARVLFSLPSQWSLYHRQYFWPAEVGRWVKNLATRWRHRRADARTLAALNRASYDVFALQVPGDTSLINGGDGWTTERLLREGLASFKAHAPADRHLVVKIHPLARGHGQDGTQALAIATSLGIADRVHVLWGGPLAPLLDPARGLVTISSTSALASIDKDKPTLILGKGIARRPGLAQCGPAADTLDSFWTNDTIAEPNVKAAYWHLLSSALIPGDAYRFKGQYIAADALLHRLPTPGLRTTSSSYPAALPSLAK